MVPKNHKIVKLLRSLRSCEDLTTIKTQCFWTFSFSDETGSLLKIVFFFPAAGTLATLLFGSSKIRRSHQLCRSNSRNKGKAAMPCACPPKCDPSAYKVGLKVGFGVIRKMIQSFITFITWGCGNDQIWLDNYKCFGWIRPPPCNSGVREG